MALALKTAAGRAGSIMFLKKYINTLNGWRLERLSSERERERRRKTSIWLPSVNTALEGSREGGGRSD